MDRTLIIEAEHQIARLQLINASLPIGHSDQRVP